jgi:hypothetical protein
MKQKSLVKKESSIFQAGLTLKIVQKAPLVDKMGQNKGFWLVLRRF